MEAIELFLTKQVPIEQTIRNCTDITKFLAVKNVKGGAHKDREYLGKVVRWYHSNEVVGTINYILSGNKVPDTENCRPIMDLPDSFPIDINYRYYIEKSMRNAL